MSIGKAQSDYLNAPDPDTERIAAKERAIEDLDVLWFGLGSADPPTTPHEEMAYSRLRTWIEAQ